MIEPRPGVLDVDDVAHGGDAPPGVVDFSANVNPYGPAPAVEQAIQAARIEAYPDRHATALRDRLAEKFGVAKDQALAGNGGAEIIWLIALAYLRPGDRTAILGPTFGEYARATRVMAATPETFMASQHDDFAPPIAEFGDFIERVRPRIAFLCNPNNPTGRRADLDSLDELASRFPDVLFVIDEAYATCVLDPTPASPRRDNVLRLGSLTKAHALAGLRLGYAVGPREIIRALGNVQPPWSVNAVALAAGVAALHEDARLRQTLGDWKAHSDALADDLRRLDLRPVPSETPFFLLPLPDATAVARSLIHRGVRVRPCASFGLPDFIRISPRRPEQNRLLLAAIEAELAARSEAAR